MQNLSVDEFINSDYKEYAEEVSFRRALPSIVDGMKPVRRKIFYYMKKSKNAGFIRVSSIAGGLAEKCNYHHGEASAQKTIINMSKDFPGSNNIPILLPKGMFGSKFLPGSAAQARYIQSAYNPLMDLIFLDDDILPQNHDLESPEPEYYLPIIPMFLVNGIAGIGIGYAVNILPRKPIDILKMVEESLEGEIKSDPLPYFRNCHYDVLRAQEGGFDIKGRVEPQNNKLIASELIPGQDRNKFIERLINMQESDKIKSYKDESKEEFRFIIEPSKSYKDHHDFLGLRKTFHENYTILDENNTIAVFPSIQAIVKHFTTFRLTFYTKRKTKIIETLETEVRKNEAVILFIENIKKVSECETNEQVSELFKLKIHDDMIKYCMDRPLHFFRRKNKEELQDNIKKLKLEIDYYQKVSEKELYIKDLEKLKTKLG